MQQGEQRYGGWMQTATGRRFWPLDPRPEDVRIEDIAHALSNVCRFGGHCREFYSVAQHSVLVSLAVEGLGGAPRHQLAALLHDATEAYIGDMVRPLKRTQEMLPFVVAELRLCATIAGRFGFDPHSLETSLIRTADEILLATEARDIMGGQSAGKWTLLAEPMAEVITPMSPLAAREAFLFRFHALGGKS